MIRLLHMDTPAERYVVGGILALMLAATLLVFGFGLNVRANNRALVQQITQAEDAATPYLRSDSTIPLPSLLTAERQVHESLQAEWDALVARVETFDKGMDLFSSQSGDSEEGRIDFKVALYNARTNLQEQARMRGRTLPEDLGVQETIDADEPAETLLWQLATVVRFMERAIELGIPEVERVRPLPPTVHVAPEESLPFAREFPLHITLQCSFAELYGLVDMLHRQGSYFALRQFDIKKSTPSVEENLLVDLVYAGEVFDVLTLVTEEAPPEPAPLVPATDAPSTNDWGELW